MFCYLLIMILIVFENVILFIIKIQKNKTCVYLNNLSLYQYDLIVIFAKFKKLH